MLQIIVGFCLLALPFAVSRGLADRLLNRLLTPEFAGARPLRLAAGSVLCLIPLLAGLYFILHPLMPGSSVLFVDALRGGYSHRSLGDLHVRIIPLTCDNRPDSERMIFEAIPPSGLYQCTVNFGWMENRVLLKVYDLGNDGIEKISRVVTVSPLARAGIIPTNVSIARDLDVQGIPFPLTPLLTAVSTGLVLVLLFLLYYGKGDRRKERPRKKGGAETVGESRPTALEARIP